MADRVLERLEVSSMEPRRTSWFKVLESDKVIAGMPQSACVFQIIYGPLAERLDQRDSNVMLREWSRPPPASRHLRNHCKQAYHM